MDKNWLTLNQQSITWDTLQQALYKFLYFGMVKISPTDGSMNNISTFIDKKGCWQAFHIIFLGYIAIAIK